MDVKTTNCEGLTALKFLHAWPPFLASTEGRHVFASKGEMRRWFERKSVEVDGQPATMNTAVRADSTVVLHPKSEDRRTTLQ